MSLPPHTDDLISSVLRVRPDAVIVTQSGTPVAMPWADQANAMVQMWYGGNEGGNGLADVLFGDVNPVSFAVYIRLISHTDNLYRVENYLSHSQNAFKTVPHTFIRNQTRVVYCMAKTSLWDIDITKQLNCP